MMGSGSTQHLRAGLEMEEGRVAEEAVPGQPWRVPWKADEVSSFPASSEPRAGPGEPGGCWVLALVLPH